ncbi:MAG: lipopolysaccharide biosynthesis protein [Janthinobacterium lividum]
MKGDLTKGALWLTTARIITNLLAFVSTLLLARLLTPEDFGLVAIATTILAIVSAITDISMGNALIHHHGPTEEHFQTAFTMNIIRDGFVGLVMMACAPLVAKTYGDPRLLLLMLVFGVASALKGLYNPKTVVFTRKLVFWQDFVQTIAQKVAGLVFSATVAIIFHSYWALVAGQLAAQAIATILSYAFVSFRPRFNLKHMRELWGFSVWLTLGQMVTTLTLKFDHLLIGWYLGRPTLGLYTVGDNLAVLPTREATQPLQQVLFPGLARLVGDPERLRYGYKLAQSFVSAIALPIGFGFALLAHSLVLAAMGQKWLAAVQVIQILACVFALETLGTAVQPLAMAKGQTKMLFQRDCLSLVVRIPIIIVGMYFFGLLGIVYARGVAGLIGIAINMRFVSRLTGLSMFEQLAANTRSLLSVAGMSAAILTLQHYYGIDGERLELIVKNGCYIAAGALVYLLVHGVLWMLAGKPGGAESELLKMLSKFTDKIKSRKPVVPGQ